MKLNKELCKIAIRSIQAIYSGRGQRVGSTDYDSFVLDYGDTSIQVLAVAGTGTGLDGFFDWFWNLFIWPKNGIKYGSELSARRIMRRFTRYPNIPLLITGHSKGSPTACRLQQLLDGDVCIAFCPARGFFKPTKLKRTVLFIDSDDIVPSLGKGILYHPECDVIQLPDDNFGWSISDHFLEHIELFVDTIDFNKI